MLTDAKIKAALKAVTTEMTLNDKGEGRGAGSLLIVVRRLSDGGTSATWFARSKRDGKRTKRALGRYPDVSLSMARQMMREDVSPKLRAGKSLRVATTIVDDPTVERMFTAYAEHMEAGGKASASEVRRVLLDAGHNAADWFGRSTPAADIDEADVVGFVAEHFKRGHRGAADKARAYVSAAYGWAIKSAHDYTNPLRRDWGVTRNPAENVKKDRQATKTVDRALSAEEMRALWLGTEQGAGGFSAEIAGCIRLVLACGQRVQETLRIEGKEIDLVNALWTMPAAKTKGRKRDHVIPLPLPAMIVLRQLKRLHGDGPLFPARSDSKAALIAHTSVRQAIDRWLERPGVRVPKFSPRDLRRTWKSRAHDAGVSREIRDIIQQHAKHDTGSKAYDRADYLPQMRAAMDAWGTWVSEHVINGADEDVAGNLLAAA